MKVKPYNGTSSVMESATWYGARMTSGSFENANPGDNTGLWTGYAFDGVYTNYVGEERQTGTQNPYTHLLTGMGTYVNSKQNSSWQYEGVYRYGSSNYNTKHEKGYGSAAGTKVVNNYADGFYFYASAGTNFVEGVVVVYAIMNADFDTIDLVT